MTARVEDLKTLCVDPAAIPAVTYVSIRDARSEKANRKIQRVLLVSPSATLFHADLPRCTYPLGLGYIAAVLERSGYLVSIIDCLVEGYDRRCPVATDEEFITYGIDKAELVARIKQFQPDIVGVSSIFSNQVDTITQVFDAIRLAAPGIPIATGGAHARYFPFNYIEDFGVDAVFLSESEASFLQYLEALNGSGALQDIPGLIARTEDGSLIKNDSMGLIRQKHRDSRGFLAELDEIPFPAWHLYNMEEYFRIGAYQSPYTIGNRVGQIYTSRGCTAKCTFCTTTNFWGGKFRRRSPQNVVDELRALKTHYGIDEFHVQDDNITNDKSHAGTLFEELKGIGLPWCTPQGTALWRMDENLLDLMAASGCYQVTFAIESASQRVLNDLIKKPLDLGKTKHLIRYARTLGMMTHGFFIVGMPPMFGKPGETFAEMQLSFDFAASSGLTSASFFTATPIVGSVLLSECLRQDFVSRETPLYRMSYKQGLIYVPGLWNGRQVASLAATFNREFNSGKPRRSTRREWTTSQY